MNDKFLSNTYGYSMSKALSNKYDINPKIDFGISKSQSSDKIQRTDLAKSLYNMIGLKMSGGKFDVFQSGRFKLPFGDYVISGKYVNKGKPTDYWNVKLSMPIDIPGL